MNVLSNREKEVLKLTAWDCLSAKEIADELCIAPTTAQNHIKNIKDKLNLQKVSELCKYYFVNMYACMMLLIILPSTLENTTARRARTVRARNVPAAISRRNEYELKN